jgi:hypothetical protein
MEEGIVSELSGQYYCGATKLICTVYTCVCVRGCQPAALLSALPCSVFSFHLHLGYSLEVCGYTRTRGFTRTRPVPAGTGRAG